MNSDFPEAWNLPDWWSHKGHHTMAHPRERSDMSTTSQDTTFSEAIERLGEPPAALAENRAPSGARKFGKGTPQVESATRKPANADIKAAAADPIPIALDAEELKHFGYICP